MKFIIVFFILFQTNLHAKENCSFTINKKDLKVDWTAFKTPLKAGVNGSFDKLGVKSNLKGKSLATALTGVEFKIPVISLNTKNPERDKKIHLNFFKPAGEFISGKLLKLEKKVLKMALNINGVTKIIPLKISKKGDQFQAKGTIDVLDFSLNSALAGINKACFELHQGKTWSDVNIKLSAKFTKTCK